MSQQTLAGPVPGPPAAPAHRARARAAAAAYLVLAAVGLVGTWAYNLQHTGSGSDYLGAWFATPASSSAAVDVIVTAVVACLF